jgi:hypothetical protein
LRQQLPLLCTINRSNPYRRFTDIPLKATHQAGVPFLNAPGGTPTFQRVPTGTVATVMGLDRGGRWLQIRLPDQRTGWMAARYVGRTIAGSPPPDTAAERLVWTSPEGC